MLSDNFLYRCVENNAVINLSTWYRIRFLSAFSITGVLYLILSDCVFLAYLYVVLNRSKVILVGAVTSYAVSRGAVMQQSFVYLSTSALCQSFRFRSVQSTVS